LELGGVALGDKVDITLESRRCASSLTTGARSHERSVIAVPPGLDETVQPEGLIVSILEGCGDGVDADHAGRLAAVAS